MSEMVKQEKRWQIFFLSFVAIWFIALFSASIYESKKPLIPTANIEIMQLKKENANLKARNNELIELRDKNKNIFTNQVARNEYIFFKNDSLISLMGSDSTIELLTINLSKKVRNEWRYRGGHNDTTSEASK